MIHTTEDFYNKLATEIRNLYFPKEIHGSTLNVNYQKANYTIELFNNGCLTYRQLIGRLAKNCKSTTITIHKIVSSYIISFGSYDYKPKQIKLCNFGK